MKKLNNKLIGKKIKYSLKRNLTTKNTLRKLYFENNFNFQNIKQTFFLSYTNVIPKGLREKRKSFKTNKNFLSYKLLKYLRNIKKN